MRNKSRASRLAIHIDPEVMARMGESRGAWFESPEEIEAGIEWGLQKEELLRWVHRQMGRRLSKRERRCLELYFFQGMTYKQVAKSLGISPTGAWRAVRRSLATLEACAKEEAPQPLTATPRGTERGPQFEESP